MQEDVFRGLRDWRQTALPNDMAKRRDLNLHEPRCNTAAPAALHKKHISSVRTILTVTIMNYTNTAAYNTNQQFYLGLQLINNILIISESTDYFL